MGNPVSDSVFLDCDCGGCCGGHQWPGRGDSRPGRSPILKKKKKKEKKSHSFMMWLLL